MTKNKNLMVIATAGLVALGYAVVSTNAFADTSANVPTPVISASATPTPAVTAPAVTAPAVTAPAVTAPAVTPPAAPTISSDVSATAGIQAPSGMANPSIGTMPTSGDDDGDDQSSGLSAGVSLSGDDSGDDNGNISSSVGASISQSDDNGGDSQQNNDGQGGSGSDD